DVLSADESLALLEAHLMSRAERKGVIETGYPGYDTSVGWFHYDDAQIRENARRAVGQGFTALKLKVGSADMERDIRRAHLVRETVGSEVRVMLDVNQQWTLPRAVRACLALARAIAPIPLALGEHVPNRVLFKNFMQAGAAQFIQVDAVRVAGISEFITISLLARKFGLKVVPHVGDMGQIHQHLVLFNHIALGLEIVFLEYIPHLQNYFLHPARVEDGVYRTPQQPGSSSDLK